MDYDGTLTFRPAQLEDRVAVEALCAKIWDGDDYIPRCFETWARDTEGEFTLCFAGERLAGLSKLSWLTPGEAWLEGLRKDPDIAVKGIGAALCKRYLTRLAGTAGLKSVRFSTYYENHASIKLNEAIGFIRVDTARLMGLGPEKLASRAATQLPADPRVEPLRSAEEALAFVRASGWFGAFIHQTWHSYPWSEAFFRDHYVQPGHCHALRRQGRIAAMAAVLVDPLKGVGAVPFFDAEDAEAAQALMETLEGRLVRDGVPAVETFVPPGGTRAQELLKTLGWSMDAAEDDYYVYELPLDRLAAYR